MNHNSKLLTIVARTGFSLFSALLTLSGIDAQTPRTEAVLHSFGAVLPRGGNPEGGLLRSATGDLYGTAFQGGAFNHGVVYKVDPSGNQTLLHTFTGGADANPQNRLTVDAAGNLYGTTLYEVFKVDTSGKQTVLHDFTEDGEDIFVNGGVVLDAQGNVYGTAGNFVFKLDPTGAETTLYTFSGFVAPQFGVILVGGNLYGTSLNAGLGAVYKLSLAGQFTSGRRRDPGRSW